jgi:Kdo2-lipid IVA lauroyltransferase/acyltransferase
MPSLPPLLRPLHALLWLAGSLSPRAAYRLGGGLGRWVRRLRTREARITEANIARCFPELDGEARQRLIDDALAETARTALETMRLWTRPAAEALARIVEVHGREHLEAARAGGRGVLVAAPHLGNWELLNRYLASIAPLAIVYRVPQNRYLEPLLRQGRGGDRLLQLRAEPGSVRGMLRHLRDGGMLGLLPDQRPDAGEGEWAPFFGHPARTMTLLSKLARKAGVEVVFAFAERLPAATGFRVRFVPAPDRLLDPDPRRATAALNAGIEACVRLAPAQYEWSYRRFPRRPPPAVGHGAAAGPSRSP